ncbi:CD225/dispanin family protein [Streptomonospora wellingtoniae]|uniref:CD225/dispanin family protein n=1 Tax=Streptomonospora wellingtoniae TaxID=3075544 RepID=A0ABU2KVS8_9ACTN|nr:CD225/dispanin family protein [Streptomonospora sp. DSM 45055]MDT0303392.1 CD225/dispanin family protein [Streptomonospora sp. DSM 45055]
MSYGTPPGPPPGNHTPPPGGYPPGARADPPNDFLVPAILSMFCCWPLAIPAILSAAKVNAQWNLGDYTGAQERAAKAKKFTIIAVVVGVIVYVLSTVGYVGIMATALSSMPTTTY